MKESAGYQAASAGQQTVEGSVGAGSAAHVDPLLEKDEKDEDYEAQKKVEAVPPRRQLCGGVRC